MEPVLKGFEDDFRTVEVTAHPPHLARQGHLNRDQGMCPWLAIVWRRMNATDMIQRADCGTQYYAHSYQQLLRKRGLVCRMSKKGNCCDNAAPESEDDGFTFDAAHGERFETRAQAKAQVFDDINAYCDGRRLC